MEKYVKIVLRVLAFISIIAAIITKNLSIAIIAVIIASVNLGILIGEALERNKKEA